STVLFHRPRVAIFGCFHAPLGERVQFVRSDANRLEKLLRRTGAAVAKAQIVLRGAPPVAVSLEEKFAPGVRIQIFLRRAQLRSLRGRYFGSVVLEEYRLALQGRTIVATRLGGFEAMRQFRGIVSRR